MTYVLNVQHLTSNSSFSDNPHNMHLDKCFRIKHARSASSVAWDSLGAVGQLSIFLIAFMSSTLTISIFLARAKRRRQDGESYLGFLIRDIQGTKKKKRKKLRKRVGRGTLDEDLLSDDDEGGFRSVPARPGKSSKRSSSTCPPRPRSSHTNRSRSKSKARQMTPMHTEDKTSQSVKPSTIRTRSKSRANSRSKSVKRNSKEKSNDKESSTPRRQLV